jgi:hypothetical protein
VTTVTTRAPVPSRGPPDPTIKVEPLPCQELPLYQPVGPSKEEHNSSHPQPTTSILTALSVPLHQKVHCHRSNQYAYLKHPFAALGSRRFARCSAICQDWRTYTTSARVAQLWIWKQLTWWAGSWQRDCCTQQPSRRRLLCDPPRFRLRQGCLP